MSDRDEFRATEVLDQADDLRLGERDRDDLLGLTADNDQSHAAIWGPGPDDLKPWDDIYIRYGREGQ